MEQIEEVAAGMQEPQLDVAELPSQFDFEQQQNQLAHLRDTLQRTQQSLSTTEKEKEVSSLPVCLLTWKGDVQYIHTDSSMIHIYVQYIQCHYTVYSAKRT